MTTPIDYVLCVGHFLGKDEDVYTFFEPELPPHAIGLPRTKGSDGLKPPGERRSSVKFPSNKSSPKSSQSKPQRPVQNHEKKNQGHVSGQPVPEKSSWNVLDLKGENYFSCAVGRNRTNARYLLPSPDDVVSFLKKLADATTPNEWIIAKLKAL